MTISWVHVARARNRQRANLQRRRHGRGHRRQFGCLRWTRLGFADRNRRAHGCDLAVENHSQSAALATRIAFDRDFIFRSRSRSRSRRLHPCAMVSTVLLQTHPKASMLGIGWLALTLILMLALAAGNTVSGHYWTIQSSRPKFGSLSSMRILRDQFYSIHCSAAGGPTRRLDW
jgi:hypothetical protein